MRTPTAYTRAGFPSMSTTSFQAITKPMLSVVGSTLYFELGVTSWKPACSR